MEESPPHIQKSNHFYVIWTSGVSPIDPARREIQNALGEMKIGDFLFLMLFDGLGHP